MVHPAKLLAFASLLLITLAGCTGGPSSIAMKNRPPDVDLRGTSRSPAAVETVPEPTTNTAPAPEMPAPQSPTFAIPSGNWVHLNRWAQSNGLGAVSNLTLSGQPAYALNTDTGSFVLRRDSVLAQWAGLELRLGFKPQLIGKEPFLHRLDLEKNLVPLLANLPAPTPGPRVIVLDPGHGGRDGGTRSAKGELEKDYTLDWARRLQAVLENDGWQVFLTRTNDIEVPLADRVSIADQHKADLFLSLHFNAAGPQHAGIETYCLTPTGMPSNVTRGYEDNATLAFPNNQFDAQNLQLAWRLHRAVVTATGGKDRGVRRARFLTVLRGQNRPAALIEGGYLSNPAEAALIVSTEYRQKLAEAVAAALR